MANGKAATILAVDCGDVTTRVVLIEKQNNIYRLAAEAKVISAYGPPWNDVTLGISEAIEEIEADTGRRLLAQNGEPLFSQAQGEGVDAFITVMSAAQPLRVLLAGLTKDVGLVAARKAIAATYTSIVEEVALDDAWLNGGMEEKISAIQQAEAELILLVGGTDGGADASVMTLAHIIGMALKTAQSDTRPYVLYAGNAELRTALVEIIGGLSDFKSLNNILPTVDRNVLDGVQAEVDILYRQLKLRQVPGFDTLAKWSSNRVVTTVKSFSQTIHYLGQSYNINVLGADIGSASAAIAARRDGLQRSLTRADIGVGSSLPSLLAQVELDSFERWLPFEISQEDLRNFLHNKGIFPQTVPTTYQEVLLELSAVREALRLMLTEAKSVWQEGETRQRRWSNWDLIVGSGQPLTQLPYPALAALALLDSLEPVGIFSLALDTAGLVGMLGGIASVEPLAAAQVAGYDALLNLGTVVAPLGVGRPGETALKLKMTYQDERELEMEIPFGVIEIIPLGGNEQANLEVRAGRNFSLHPAGGPFARKMTALVEGGTLGVIVDTRGRPIALPREDDERRQRIQDWLVKLGLKPGAVGFKRE